MIKNAGHGDIVETRHMFVTKHNSDLTEGRGSEMDHKFYGKIEDALQGIKGIDVQGTDGSVHVRYVEFYEDGVFRTRDEMVYGRHSVPGKGWIPGWVKPEFNPIFKDEEYQEYIQLKARLAELHEKFENAV